MRNERTYPEDDSESHTEATTSLLQDECDEFTRAFVSGADEDLLIKMKDCADRLKGTKIAERAHKVPQSAPDFELPDQHGNMVRLSDLLSAGPVVMSFFRGSWCPYCSLELKALNRFHEKLQGEGATLIAISPMIPEKTQAMTEEYHGQENPLKFPVLSDPGNAVSRKYGLVFEVDPMLHGIYKSFGFDIPAFNGDSSWELPMPATYIVLPTPERRIHFAMVDEDYSIRAEPWTLMKSLHDASKPIGMGSDEDEDNSERQARRKKLQEECDEFTQAFVSSADEDLLIKMKDCAERLKGTKIAERAHKVPQSAPDFELPDQHGNMVRLSELLSSGPVVMSFYRGSWCPYCSFELNALNRFHQKLQAKGAALIAISPMLPDKTKAMTEEYKGKDAPLQFPVLSDLGNQVSKKYGLVFEVDPMLHGIYKSFGFDVPAYNGDDSWELPMPATYIVLPTPERRIHFSMVDEDYTQRAEPRTILKSLKAASKPIGMGSNEEEDRAERRALRKKRKEEEEKSAAKSSKKLGKDKKKKSMNDKGSSGSKSKKQSSFGTKGIFKALFGSRATAA